MSNSTRFEVQPSRFFPRHQNIRVVLHGCQVNDSDTVFNSYAERIRMNSYRILRMSKETQQHILLLPDPDATAKDYITTNDHDDLDFHSHLQLQKLPLATCASRPTSPAAGRTSCASRMFWQRLTSQILLPKGVSLFAIKMKQKIMKIEQGGPSNLPKS